MSSKRLNNQFKHFCPKCFDYGFVSSLGRETQRRAQDEKIGDKVVDSQGYMAVYVGTRHPSARHCGRIREHVLVMENHIGRRLKKGEVIHHIDGNKINNKLSNLDLCTVQEHNACHGKIGGLVFELVCMGIIGYSRKTKSYFIKKKCRKAIANLAGQLNW